MTGSRKPPSAAGRRSKRRGARLARWPLQEAKARFSELVRRAGREGPQHVTVHGHDQVVVLLEVSEDVVCKRRLLVEEDRRSGHTISQPDLFIAATALHHGMTVISRGTRQYERAGVPMFNPWES